MPGMLRSRNVTTGRGHERERSRTAAAGFDHHLVKPADIGALHAVLAAALH